MSATEQLSGIASALRKDLESNGENLVALFKVVSVLEGFLARPELLADKRAQTYFFEDFSASILQDLCKIPYLSSQEVRPRQETSINGNSTGTR